MSNNNCTENQLVMYLIDIRGGGEGTPKIAKYERPDMERMLESRYKYLKCMGYVFLEFAYLKHIA